MLFNSLSFLLFFPVVLAARFAPLPWRVRKLALLLLSYGFYAAWYPPHLVILWVSTLVDWTVADRIFRTPSPARKRLWLGLSLTTNLGLLAAFKYSAFLVTNLNAAFAHATFAHASLPGFHLPVPHLLLPIGISFYTFEALSYTIDVYRGKLEPTRSLLDFALFITFFPRMVAGPIMRAELFLPQCEAPHRVRLDDLGQGLTLLLFGLFEKVVLADGIFAPVADTVYAGAGSSFSEAWAGTLGFACQIFFDFAGYSTCAIGLARCLGFRLPLNFNSPYAALNLSDFWSRWHISLSTWLRDYLYIPLGGNRAGTARTYGNLMLTMLLGGLWHGAAWRFLLWGGIHGAYLVVQRGWQRALPNLKTPAWAGVLVTFTLVCFTWVFFRATDMATALRLCGEMLGAGGAHVPLVVPSSKLLVFLGTLATLGVQWRFRRESIEASLLTFRPVVRVALLAGMLLLIVISPGDNRAFIYFQF